MNNQLLDWKDIASSYYDKCLSLTILFVLFVFIVFPNFESRVIKSKEKVLDAVEIIQDLEQKIEQPQEMAKPIVNIEIVEGSDSDDESIETIESIDVTVLDVEEVRIAPTSDEVGKTDKFAIYEEAPVIAHYVEPEYPKFAKQAKIQGTVVLDIEILANGTVGAIEVKKSVLPGPGGLDEAAIAAVRKSKFQPAKNAGKPIGVWITLPIIFKIEK